MNRDTVENKISDVLKVKKEEAMKLLTLTMDIHKLCGQEEPDADKINELLKKRKSVIDRINELDSILKNNRDSLDSKMLDEIREIFKKIKDVDDTNQKILTDKFNEYKMNLMRVNQSIRLNNAYKARNISESGSFIDTKE